MQDIEAKVDGRLQGDFPFLTLDEVVYIRGAILHYWFSETGDGGIRISTKDLVRAEQPAFVDMFDQLSNDLKCSVSFIKG